MVEYGQFKAELDLSDEEAQSHPDTLGSFNDIYQFVQNNAELTELYQAAVDQDHPNHATAIAEVRAIEAEIVNSLRDCDLISAKERERRIRKLGKKTGVMASASLFLDLFTGSVDQTDSEFQPSDISPEKGEENYALSPILVDFLFSTSGNEVSVDPSLALLLSGENFVKFLNLVRDDYCNDDEATIKAIQKFAENTNAEFIETMTPEAELSIPCHRAEIEISTFIEQNVPLFSIDLLNKNDLMNIGQIYNPNNMLVLAKDLLGRYAEGLTVTQIDMLYRYRTILKRIENRLTEIYDTEEYLRSRPQKNGSRTWAGVVRLYGCEEGGLIDTNDYKNFSENEDPGHRTLTVDGTVVRLDGASYEPITFD